MKWTKKGYEFDELFERIKNIKSVYLFGAFLSGRVLCEKYQNVINIKGFIDNDKEKQGKTLLDKKVFALSEIKLQEDEAIIISVQAWSITDIEKQLENEGYEKEINFFTMQVFFPVFSLYYFDELCLPSLNMLPSTACNLNCKYCLNFTPYIKKHIVRSLDILKRDVDLLFSKVDYIYFFHITGGEPFLYKELDKLIRYIYDNYGAKIGQFETTTNGTIVPSDQLAQTLAECNIGLSVDDYREQIQDKNYEYDNLIKKLNKFGVSFRIRKVDSWVDLDIFKTDHSKWSDIQLAQHFIDCDVMWSEYRHGKMYLCNYAAYAALAGIGDVSEDEYFDLNNLTKENRRECLEFRLGYSKKGYTEFCKRCAGVRSTKLVKPAVQA